MTQSRLARLALTARGPIVVLVLLAVVQTSTTIAFAALVSQSIAHAIDRRSEHEILGLVGWLVVVVVVRAVTNWVTDATTVRAAATVKSGLRRRLMSAIQRNGHAVRTRRNSGWLAAVIGPGLDALDGYFIRYLPQLILTALATPAIVIILMASDPTTGIIVLVTLPLIPLFMAMIGIATRAVQQAHWRGLTTLSTAFLDLVDGLSTLKVFGRERRQAARIRDLTEHYRAQTMRVVRVSFLSGFVLELIASLSVAVVAVSIGLRLLDGSMPLSVGLFVLLLAPEAYLPIRQVGANYHAAADGIAAADDVFAILDETARPPGLIAAGGQPDADASDPKAVLTLRGVGVQRDGHTVLCDVDASFAPGTITAVIGPSGTGKTSLFYALLGFVAADGSIELGARALDELPQSVRMSLIAWAGQDPALITGSVASNVALGDSSPAIERVEECMRRVGLSSIDPNARLGDAGSGLSGGQSQRLAIARCLYRAWRHDTPVLLVDEPTSALDARHERQVIEALRDEAAGGRIVIVISHRADVIAGADHVIDLQSHSVLEPSI